MSEQDMPQSDGSASTLPAPFSNLDGHKFMNLTTFRKTGIPVTSPVWFAAEGGRLYVVTDGNSWKVKRLRNDSRVEVGPSTVRGQSLGDVVPGQARIIPESEGKKALSTLLKKYGWQLRAFQLMWRIRDTKHVFLEISPKSEDAQEG